MKVIIKEGKHLSNQITLPRLGLWNTGEVICKVKFTSESKYIIGGEDQLDWNKLSAGASWGYFPLVKQYQMHFNSSRWGWRYNPNTDKIEITPYFYNEGVRNYAETLGIAPIELDIDVEYELTIKPYSSFVNYIVKKDGKVIYKGGFDQSIPSVRGFLAIAYFGGTQPAPHDISYELKYL